MQLCILLNLIPNEANKDKKKKRKKKTKTQEEERQKKKMPILNRISTIKVLFAILWDWQLAKVVLAAYNSQAQYLQLYHRVKYLQPGGGKPKYFPYVFPCPCLAKRSKAKHNTCSRKPQGTRLVQVLHSGLTSDRILFFFYFCSHPIWDIKLILEVERKAERKQEAGLENRFPSKHLETFTFSFLIC